MLLDYFAVGGQEVWNAVRTQAYLANVGSPFDSGASWCTCDSLTRQIIEGPTAPANYDKPDTDPAPWYDTSVPESAFFLGFLPLTMDGIDDNPRARTVTNTVGGGGIISPLRELPRTMTVTGLLVGASCCAAEYGLHWLTEALAACADSGCDGDCVQMYNCCPAPGQTKAQFDAAHKRTFRRAALISGPTVTSRRGGSPGETCTTGTCPGGGQIIEVEFQLVFASPWAWTDTSPLLDVALPIGGTGDCIEWCVQGSGSGGTCPAEDCKFAPCASDTDKCADPMRPVTAPPTPSLPDASFCIPVQDERACYTVDLSARPGWSADVPVITVYSGSSELRNLLIQIFEKQPGTALTCDQIADMSRCSPLSQFFITYMPAGSSMTFDGQIRQAYMDCGNGCQSAANAYGDTDGGPVRITDLTQCELCVCISSDPLFPPAADARLTFGVSGREY